MSFVSKMNLLEELFECPVCLEKLGYANKVLPCQHTLCLKCIRQIYLRNYNIKCPECRKIYYGKIEDLPANFFLIKMLDKIREMKKTNVSVINDARTITGVSRPGLTSKSSHSVTIASTVNNEFRQNQPSSANRYCLTNVRVDNFTPSGRRPIVRATRRLDNF